MRKETCHSGLEAAWTSCSTNHSQRQYRRTRTSPILTRIALQHDSGPPAQHLLVSRSDQRQASYACQACRISVECIEQVAVDTSCMGTAAPPALYTGRALDATSLVVSLKTTSFGLLQDRCVRRCVVLSSKIDLAPPLRGQVVTEEWEVHSSTKLWETKALHENVDLIASLVLFS